MATTVTGPDNGAFSNGLHVLHMTEERPLYTLPIHQSPLPPLAPPRTDLPIHWSPGCFQRDSVHAADYTTPPHPPSPHPPSKATPFEELVGGVVIEVISVSAKLVYVLFVAVVVVEEMKVAHKSGCCRLEFRCVYFTNNLRPIFGV